MGIFGGYRADRLIAEVRESGDPTSARAKAALAKLQGLGPNAIKPIVDALATADLGPARALGRLRVDVDPLRV